MDKHLHILSFDVPWPVDYGGVVDIFCTIKALHSAGIKIHLHCFEYGRGEQPELEKYCTEVHYYKRLSGHKCISPHLPYIVTSRYCNRLLDKLLEDDFPVLAEGIHCTWLLNDDRFTNRKILVRLCNTEYTYYDQLSRSTSAISLFRKMYYRHESRMLKRYEKKITGKAVFLALSEQDVMRYRQEFHAKSIAWLPPLLPFEHVTCKEGIGCFCLYHGNLSVPENEKAALWLLRKVFNDIKMPLVIAGKGPTKKLERMVQRYTNTCLIPDPSEDDLQDLIHKAQINILPSFNSTGIKLKLLNALFNGRHCIVNDATVYSTGLEPACHIGQNANAFKSIIIQLYHKPFGEEEIVLRKRLLLDAYNNSQNAQRLIQWIW